MLERRSGVFTIEVRRPCRVVAHRAGQVESPPFFTGL